jgi:hypothetical protein
MKNTMNTHGNEKSLTPSSAVKRSYPSYNHDETVPAYQITKGELAALVEDTRIRILEIEFMQYLTECYDFDPIDSYWAQIKKIEAFIGKEIVDHAIERGEEVFAWSHDRRVWSLFSKGIPLPDAIVEKLLNHQKPTESDWEVSYLEAVGYKEGDSSGE